MQTSKKGSDKSVDQCKVPQEINELDRMPGETVEQNDARCRALLKSNPAKYTRLSFKHITDKEQGTTADGRPRCLCYDVQEGVSFFFAERIPCPNPEWGHWDEVDPFPYPGKSRITLPCLEHAVFYLKYFYRRDVQDNKSKLAKALAKIEELKGK